MLESVRVVAVDSLRRQMRLGTLVHLGLVAWASFAFTPASLFAEKVLGLEVLLFTGNALAALTQDRAQRSLRGVLARPLSRDAYLLGRLLGALAPFGFFAALIVLCAAARGADLWTVTVDALWAGARLLAWAPAAFACVLVVPLRFLGAILVAGVSVRMLTMMGPAQSVWVRWAVQLVDWLTMNEVNGLAGSGKWLALAGNWAYAAALLLIGAMRFERTDL